MPTLLPPKLNSALRSRLVRSPEPPKTGVSNAGSLNAGVNPGLASKPGLKPGLAKPGLNPGFGS